MKLRSVISAALALALMLVCGCGAASEKVLFRGKNFTFTAEMVAYMASYTKIMLADEMKAAGVDESKPLSEQMRGDESWEDYLYARTVESMEEVLLYCEAASGAQYAVTEGMMYKANENVVYMTNTATQLGMDTDEYIRSVYGEGVTLDAVSTCLQMMTVCEGYELYLMESTEVSADEALAYADGNPSDFLRFDALRYTTKDKTLADSLADAETPEEFLSVMSPVSGLDRTDKDKNGYPDSLEVTGATVSGDKMGDFAAEAGRAVGDTVVTEEADAYTVTMITDLPERDAAPVWDFRLIYISTESSTDPAADVESLLEQWKDKEGGEEDFKNLAARYSDDPTAYYGGLFSGAAKDDMPNTKIADWVTDPARAEGDTATVSVDENGAYMLYYIGGNIPKWQFDSAHAIKTKSAEDAIAAVKDEIMADFEMDENAVRKIVIG